MSIVNPQKYLFQQYWRQWNQVYYSRCTLCTTYYSVSRSRRKWQEILYFYVLFNHFWYFVYSKSLLLLNLYKGKQSLNNVIFLQFLKVFYENFLLFFLGNNFSGNLLCSFFIIIGLPPESFNPLMKNLLDKPSWGFWQFFPLVPLQE